MVQHQQQKQANMFGNLSQEFKFKLLNSNINQHSSWMEGSAMVSLVTNGANIALLLNGKNVEQNSRFNLNWFWF